MEHMDNKELNFKELIKLRIKWKNDLQKYLQNLSVEFFNKFEYKNLKQCGKCRCNNCIDHIHINEQDLYFLIHEYNEGHPMNYYFLLDELNSLIKLSM